MCVVLQADSWCLGTGEDTGRRLSRWLGKFRRYIHVVVTIYTFVGLSRPASNWVGKEDAWKEMGSGCTGIEDHEDMNRDSLELDVGTKIHYKIHIYLKQHLHHAHQSNFKSDIR